MKDKSEDKQVVTRLKRRIKKLKYVNKRDLQEMAERGKEIVEMAKIVRGCENQISAEVFEMLMEVIDEFEERC